VQGISTVMTVTLCQCFK